MVRVSDIGCHQRLDDVGRVIQGLGSLSEQPPGTPEPSVEHDEYELVLARREIVQRTPGASKSRSELTDREVSKTLFDEDGLELVEKLSASIGELGRRGAESRGSELFGKADTHGLGLLHELPY
jgi:hypothetical protein